MRGYGTQHPMESGPVPPDTVSTILLGGATAQSLDWPSSAQIAKLTGVTTAGAQLNFYVNMHSTAAAVPSSGTTSTTGVSFPILGTDTFQVPGSSTGFSVIAPTSGYVHVACWKKGG